MASSDEVEAGVVLFEVAVDYRGSLVLASALANKGGQAMGVTDAGGLFDGAGDVVVGVAELVGQVFNLVWRSSNRVVQYSKPGRSRHALLGSYRDQVKLVHVLISHTRINDGAGQRVFKSTDLSIKDSSVDTLAAVDIHQLARVLTTSLDECRLDLFDLWNTDALDLTFTDSISVEDDPGRVGAVVLLEAFQSFDNAGLQRGGTLLANFVLDDTRGPVSCSRLVH